MTANLEALAEAGDRRAFEEAASAVESVVGLDVERSTFAPRIGRRGAMARRRDQR